MIERLQQWHIEDCGWTWYDNCYGNWSREAAVDELRRLNPGYDFELREYSVYLYIVDEKTREVISYRHGLGESIWYKPTGDTAAEERRA